MKEFKLQPLDPEDEPLLRAEMVAQQQVDQQLRFFYSRLAKLDDRDDDIAHQLSRLQHSLVLQAKGNLILQKEVEILQKRVDDQTRIMKELYERIMRAESSLERLQLASKSVTFLVGDTDYSFGPVGIPGLRDIDT